MEDTSTETRSGLEQTERDESLLKTQLEGSAREAREALGGAVRAALAAGDTELRGELVHRDGDRVVRLQPAFVRAVRAYVPGVEPHDGDESSRREGEHHDLRGGNEYDRVRDRTPAELAAHNRRIRRAAWAGLGSADRHGDDDGLRSLLRGDVRYMDADMAAFERTVDRVGKVEVRDLLKGTATAGGHLVPTSMVRRIYEGLVERSTIFASGTTIITTESGEDLLVPRISAYGTAAIVAEAAAIGESDPTYAQDPLKAYKYAVLLQASRELIEDEAVGLEGHIARETAIALDKAYGPHFMLGTGTSQPQGLFTGASVGVTGLPGQTTSVTANDLVDLYFAVNREHRARGAWVMKDSTLQAIAKLKDGDGQFMLIPSLRADVPDQILGRPVYADKYAPAMAASTKSIIFGNLEGYYVRAVRTLAFDSSVDFAFSQDLTTFRAIWRLDGRLIDADAVKAYQNAAS